MKRCMAPRRAEDAGAGRTPAGVLVNTDLIANHNGFAIRAPSTLGEQHATADDVSFVQAGGYPGFMLMSGNDGDFHGAFEGRPGDVAAVGG